MNLRHTFVAFSVFTFFLLKKNCCISMSARWMLNEWFQLLLFFFLLLKYLEISVWVERMLRFMILSVEKPNE